MPLLAGSGGADTAIVVVVNDEPISNYKVDQRVKMMRLGGNEDAMRRLQARLKSPGIQDEFRAFATKRNPQSKEEVVALQREFVQRLRDQVLSQVQPGQRDKALIELIQERLQVQEAKRLEVLVTDEELGDLIRDIAKRNEKSPKEFEAQILAQGIRFESFKERIRAQASWQRVLNRRFRSQLTIGNDEVDRAVSAQAAAPSGAEMSVVRAVFASAADADAGAKAADYAKAEQLVGQAKGCKNFEKLVKAIPGARFENLGTMRASALPEQAKPILIGAKAGDVPPPLLSASGVEVYAVCKVVVPKNEAAPEEQANATPEDRRSAARAKIERTKLAALSKGLMSDLCAKASIEFRNGASSDRVCDIE